MLRCVAQNVSDPTHFLCLHLYCPILKVSSLNHIVNIINIIYNLQVLKFVVLQMIIKILYSAIVRFHFLADYRYRVTFTRQIAEHDRSWNFETNFNMRMSPSREIFANCSTRVFVIVTNPLIRKTWNFLINRFFGVRLGNNT